MVNNTVEMDAENSTAEDSDNNYLVKVHIWESKGIHMGNSSVVVV
jgi:hypothetical protein